MKSFLDNILINDKRKNLTKLNKNYLFVVTVFFTALLISLFLVFGFNLGSYSVRPNWTKFSVNNLLQAIVNSFSHGNLQHCLLNTLCFFTAGIYLERKMGSFNFLIFLALEIVFTGFASATNDISLGWYGFSGANYGLYGFIIFEYISTLLFREKRDKYNIIYGAVMLGLIYFAMCFSGGTTSFVFEIYPYDLLNNLGHASGFVVGIFLGIIKMAYYFANRDFKEKK